MIMKRIIASILLGLLSASALYAGGDKFSKKTYLYSVKDSDSLYLDKYSFADDTEDDKPCVIFMFGGGFITGVRDKESYIPYFRFLAENGYAVVSIDYRLGLKPVLENKDMSARDFIRTFVNAIYIAVEDLFDATAFTLGKADEWGIDPGMIIANGSSAGAISVLQGEYSITNRKEVASKLPEGFNYAGVISFAGAIFENARDINFGSAPCPILMFHGDADSNVPYDKLKKLGIGFYGSKHIAKKLDAMRSPYWFYSEENADHIVAVRPMDGNREEILFFLDKLVKGKEKTMINTNVNPIDSPVLKKKFKIMDFVKANFSE